MFRESGQQACCKLHPSVQSWIAPKLCPTSCAMTCHSLSVMLVTPVPLVTSPLLLVLLWTRQSVPSHATPTSREVAQFVRRCHRPAASPPPLAERHCEKADNRSFKSSPPLVALAGHATFHGSSLLLPLGHVRSATLSSTTPSEMLKVRWYSAETVFMFVLWATVQQDVSGGMRLRWEQTQDGTHRI